MYILTAVEQVMLDTYINQLIGNLVPHRGITHKLCTYKRPVHIKRRMRQQMFSNIKHDTGM